MAKARQKQSIAQKNVNSLKLWAIKQRKTLIIVVIIIITIEVFLTQYTRYAYTVIQCGRLPIASESNMMYGGTMGYNFPGSSSYRVRAWSKYYCTKEDAENQGIEPNPFSEGGFERQKELEKQNNWPPRRKP